MGGYGALLVCFTAQSRIDWVWRTEVVTAHVPTVEIGPRTTNRADIAILCHRH